MAGETNLDKLLQSMEPKLLPDTYVFCTVDYRDENNYAELFPIGSFAEDEGLTLILPQSNANDNNIPYEGLFRCITLSVHSSLEAVGLTAAFATKLAEHQISANVVAGFYHDHIFVQAEKAELAMEALGEFNN